MINCYLLIMVSVIFSEMVCSGFCSTKSAGLLAVLLDMLLVALVLIEQPFTFALAVFATVLTQDLSETHSFPFSFSQLMVSLKPVMVFFAFDGN